MRVGVVGGLLDSNLACIDNAIAHVYSSRDAAKIADSGHFTATKVDNCSPTTLT